MTKMKLVAEQGADRAQDPVMRSAYALLDTLLDRAQRRQTPQTLDYAQRAERELNFDRDAEKIAQVNEGIIALGGEPYLPSPEPSPQPTPNPSPDSGEDEGEKPDDSASSADGTVSVTPMDPSSPITGDAFCLAGAAGIAAASLGVLFVSKRRGERRK